ncbi:UDP-glucosyltransferase 2 [Drosophila mojavensis]|nr:UDP-glucosyltransferase 2 [Drosophila mojavensis]
MSRTKLQLAAYAIILLVLSCRPTDGANILGLFSTFSPSHLVVHMAMMRTLADRGHNVTIVSAMKPKLAPHENITLIMAPFSEETLAEVNQFMESSTKDKVSMIATIYRMLMKTAVMLDSQYKFLLHPNVRAIYERPQTKFDLLFLGFIFNDYQLGVAAKLGIPAVISWVGVPFMHIDDEVGNIYDPAYVPNFNVCVDSSQRAMNFGQRLKNYFTWVILKSSAIILDRRMVNYYNRAFGADLQMPSYWEVRRNISLLFYNYHSHSEGPIRPTVPQSIEVGGVQNKEQPDPLPSELAEFLDNAKDGAIFFSLGTNVKSGYFPPHVMETFFKVLSSLPLRVIWKWDDLQHTPGNASNIYYHNWLPQDDILAHPNTKLFITHAGKGGIAEAQYHGVPMVAMPIFGDQPSNADNMVSAGFGLSVDWTTLTEASLAQTLNEVLQNSSYREKVRSFSALYRDRPLTARQSVVYWTEYVLRHKGAHHLQNPALHLDFVARHNLDLYACLLILLAVSVTILKLLLRCIWQTLRPLAPSKDKVKTQ